MTHTLYWSKNTGAFAVEAALVLAGVEFEGVLVDYEGGGLADPEFLAINPMGQIPALVLPGGTVMTESAAMLIYISELCSDRALSPAPGTPERAAFLRWLMFAATNIYEADLRYFYPHRYTADAGGVEAVKQAALAHMRKCCGVVDNTLGSSRFLCGSDLSLVDVYVAMVVSWFEEDTNAPNLDRLCRAVEQDPRIAPVWEKYEMGPVTAA